MLLSEEIRVFVFVGFVIAVYAAALVVIFKSARRRLEPGSPPPTKLEITIRRVSLALAGAGLLCMGYGYYIEPTWLEVTRVRIESAKVPRGAAPIRIVHISDVHSDPGPRLEDRLPEVIAAEKPRLIVFTGDSINSPQALPVFKKCLRNLAGIAPTFCVRGNWDTDYWQDLDLFGDTGARELNCEAAKIAAGAAEVWIVGMAWGNQGCIAQALDRVPADAFTVFLYHAPDEIFEAAHHKVDLYLAGHTHGGQVALPFYGALMTASRFGKRFEAGLYRVENTWMYVNRGIGMEGGPAPRVRFSARPEVTVIEISSAR